MEWVIRVARRNNWLCYHTHDSRKQEWGTDPGFPDLVLARNGRVLFVELKTTRGRITREQNWWLSNLTDGNFSTGSFVWRPTDEKEVEETLA